MLLIALALSRWPAMPVGLPSRETSGFEKFYTQGQIEQLLLYAITVRKLPSTMWPKE